MASSSTPVGTTGLAGVAELVKKLQALGALEDGKALRRAVRAGMKPAQVEAARRIPVGTVQHRSYKGNLLQPGYAKSSLHVVTLLEKDKTSCRALLSTTKEGFYAPTFVELGTSKMKAQPWLRPAFYGTADQQREGIRDSLKATVDRLAKVGA